ncbi:MAG: hypothetical protein OIF55_10030 [Amphritea sp.]|nr:hypothetical protein [Amphritea sp.]
MDKHNTGRISQILALLVAAFFVIVAVTGYQKTDDIKVLMLFGVLALVGYAVVKFLFVGVNKLLDSLDNNHKDRS